MKTYQKDFIELCLTHEVIKFGSFSLKSDRKSPYFFNAGLFYTGKALCQLGQFYAAAIKDAGIPFDVLFGPAYKGIPLVSATAIALSRQYEQNMPYTFNRVTPKDHGEGGHLVGAPLKGRVLIVDDVITVGTAVRASMQHIEDAGAQLAGLVISLDRQERGQGTQSAIQEISETYKVPVISIIKLDDLVEYLKKYPQYQPHLENIVAYRKEYGV